MKFPSIFMALAMLGGTQSWAQDAAGGCGPGKQLVKGHCYRATADYVRDLNRRFPGTLDATVAPAFPGFWSVVKEQEVLFVSDDVAYMIPGDVVDLGNNQSLATGLREPVKPVVVDVSKLPLGDAIKFGNGSRKLYVFSDVDCPYCRQLEPTLVNLPDTEIYVFQFPIAQLHPGAATISESIWCSKNKQKAWRDYMLNKVEPKAAKCANPIQRNIDLAAGLKVRGTPALVFEDGTVMPGLAPAETIKVFLAKAQTKAPAAH